MCILFTRSDNSKAIGLASYDTSDTVDTVSRAHKHMPGAPRMKREDVKTKHGEGMHFDTHVIANPANTHEWIILFKKEAGRSYFLVNDNEEIESFGRLDELIHELRELGIKSAEVHF